MRLPLPPPCSPPPPLPALAAPLHSYAGLALSAAGDKLASIESVEGETAARARQDRRSVGQGRAHPDDDRPVRDVQLFGADLRPRRIARLAPARPRRRHDDARGRRGAKPSRAIAVVKGIAQTPRFSPDGKRIALLVTIGAAKELGATQPGVRQVGEIGEKSDEQRHRGVRPERQDGDRRQSALSRRPLHLRI